MKFANHFFMPIQVDGIKEIADHVTKLTRAGPGLGELLYDKDLAWRPNSMMPSLQRDGSSEIQKSLILFWH